MKDTKKNTGLSRKEKIVQLLKKINVSHCRLSDGYITVWLEGRPLPKRRVKIRKSVKTVGSWISGLKENSIYIDNDIKDKRWRKSLALHECIERWLMHDSIWKLPYKLAHEVSEAIEKRWHVKKWGLKSWNEYMRKIEEVWRKENE